MSAVWSTAQTSPLIVYYDPISKVDKLERMISSHFKKWLGAPHSLSSVQKRDFGAPYNQFNTIAQIYKSKAWDDAFSVGRKRNQREAV